MDLTYPPEEEKEDLVHPDEPECLSRFKSKEELYRDLSRDLISHLRSLEACPMRHLHDALQGSVQTIKSPDHPRPFVIPKAVDPDEPMSQELVRYYQHLNEFMAAASESSESDDGDEAQA